MRDFLPFLDFIKRYLQTQSQVTTLFGMLLKLALAHAITKVELINENLNDVTLVIHHPFRINLQPAFFFHKTIPLTTKLYLTTSSFWFCGLSTSFLPI